jgi:protein O-GlcNAc transferase
MKRRSLRKAGPSVAVASPPDWLSRAFTTAARHIQAGMLEEARQLLILILEREPRHSDSLYLLASISMQSGDRDLGEHLLRQAISIESNKTPYWILLGNVLQQGGRLDESAVCYQSALALDAQCSDAFYNWGNTLEKQGRCKEAAECFERTLALTPHHIQARNNLANLCRQQGRLEEAAAHLERAHVQDPASMPVALNLGNVYMAQSRNEKAVECFDLAIRLAPTAAVVHNNRGNALRALKRFNEAIASYRNAINLDPARAEFFVNCGVALQSQGRLKEALDCFRRSLELAPKNAAAHGASLFTLHYDPAVGNAQLLEEHRLWAQRHAAPVDPGPRRFERSRDPERPLRIGYVSPDFRRHPIAFFTAPVLEAHDRTAFHSVCYLTGTNPDAWTDRLQRSAVLWREAPGMSDRELAEQIERDEIDIVIDLSGHTAGNRLTMFARRPAPLAVTWLGYFNTTGMAAMDYIAVDDIIAPPDEPRHYTEQAMRIGGCYLTYSGPDYAPAVSAPPALTRGFVTYGCFNTLSKITANVVALWARLLQQDPGARLVLKNPLLDDASSRQFYWQQFQALKIPPARIDLLGTSPHEELLAHYAQIDVALDPFPYNGGTTTCEALWMGVPVVTWMGGRFVSRVGATILHHAGRQEWIARSADEYLQTALTLGRDRAQMAVLRANLREEVKHSVLGDTKRFTRRWEDALRMAWRRYCAQAH